MIYFAVDEARAHLVPHYLARDWGRPLEDRMRQATYTELFRARSLERGAWIFTALDALTAPELELVHRIQSAAREAGLAVLNPALEALHRFELLEMLHRRGSNEFRAYRASGPLEGVRFPVFVRIENEHDGSLTPLLADWSALRRAMAYLWLRGIPRRELLVVEFCGTADAEGLYRKYSVFRIGDRYVPRYLHIGSHWMTKSTTREAEESMVAEEMAFLRENPHGAWVREVFEAAHIDYGRLDYGIHNGRPQAWEINFTPVLTGNPNRPPLQPHEQRTNRLTYPARAFAHAAIRQAFEALDPGPLPGGCVPVELPPEIVEQGRRARGKIDAMKRRQQWIGRMAARAGARGIGPMLRRSFGG